MTMHNISKQRFRPPRRLFMMQMIPHILYIFMFCRNNLVSVTPRRGSIGAHFSFSFNSLSVVCRNVDSVIQIQILAITGYLHNVTRVL